MKNLIRPPEPAVAAARGWVNTERARLAAQAPISVGNMGAMVHQRYPKITQGFGIGQTDLPSSGNGGAQYPEPQTGGLVPEQTGCCVASQNSCEYHPALFCGWSYLPFSTFKDQGSDANVNTGPVAANFATERVISITAERACYYRIRSIWFRSYNSTDLVTGVSMLANVTINQNPWPLEVGGIATTDRIGLASSMFDDTFWTLPVAWGVLSAINNRSRPLILTFMSPEPTVDQHIIGTLFGDPLDDCMRPKHGNVTLN